MPKRRRVATLAIVGALALAGCGSDNDSASVADFDEAMEAEAMDAPAEASGDDAVRTGGAASTGLPVADFGRDIITTVGLTMTTSDVRDTTDDIRRVVVTNGGGVFSSDVFIDEPRDDGSVPGGGQIVIKIPPQDLDRLVTELDGIGTVSRLSQDSEDVTDQLVDVEIRIRQAETSIERIETLLDDATDLAAVFAIETDLAERQVALERLKAQQRNTENLVELATLTVQVEYRSPEQLVAEEPSDGIGDAFADGWSAFVGALFAIGYVLAVSAPFLMTAAIIAALAWLLGRRLARRSAERRETRRQASDRMGPVVAPIVQHTPPPPTPADRIVHSNTESAVDADSDTLVRADDEHDA